jgi:hypothetical protein
MLRLNARLDAFLGASAEEEGLVALAGRYGLQFDDGALRKEYAGFDCATPLPPGASGAQLFALCVVGASGCSGKLIVTDARTVNFFRKKLHHFDRPLGYFRFCLSGYDEMFEEPANFKSFCESFISVLFPGQTDGVEFRIYGESTPQTKIKRTNGMVYIFSLYATSGLILDVTY